MKARADLDAHPNPVRFYGRDTPVYVYFEVYNLVRDAYGRTRYALSYEVRKPKARLDPTLFQSLDVDHKRGAERDLAETLASMDQTVRRVVSEYKGGRESDLTYLAIDVSSLSAGVYELMVEAEDQNAGTRAASVAHFKIAD